MLTTNNSNQYIRPDYLPPMPTALDAKNSPLALLAQTCSAIGSDAPNPKLVANMEKSSKSHKSSTECREKASPGSNSSSLSNSSSEVHHQMQHQQQPAHQQPKSSFKPYESSIRDQTTPEDRTSSAAHRIKSPKRELTPSQLPSSGRCHSNQSASSQRTSPPNNMRKTPSHNETSTSPHRASSKESSYSNHITASQGSPLYSASKLSESASRDPAANYPKTSMPSVPVSSSPAFFSGYTTPGLPYPMDLMTASALMSPHHAMFKAASMNPYLNYARMKVPGGGADPMMSVCRDPYCTGCALSPHMMGKSGPCPAGCTQCDHSGAKAYAAQLSAAHNSVAAAYAHAQLSALAAASQLPYICNWIAGGDVQYCGKRFGTSDELLQHLRTHTSSMPESMLAQAAATGLPPTHPLFQRTYPTPPLSPLSTARYHPYSKASLMPPSLAPPQSMQSMAGMPMHHPSLAQYFSPYSLYGPRLGQSHP